MDSVTISKRADQIIKRLAVYDEDQIDLDFTPFEKTSQKGVMHVEWSLTAVLGASPTDLHDTHSLGEIVLIIAEVTDRSSITVSCLQSTETWFAKCRSTAALAAAMKDPQVHDETSDHAACYIALKNALQRASSQHGRLQILQELKDNPT
jgi:uncharacterized protein YlxP (DUF503 family)